MAKISTKQALWDKVQKEINELLEANKSSKKFSESLLLLLENNLAPKKGGSSINPPKLNEDGDIIEAWCRFHQRYEVVNDMVISNGKSKGYCKAAISLWNKTSAYIKKCDAKAVEYMANGDFENAQEEALESRELKEKFNKPEFYDYDRDWEEFRK